MQTQLPKPRETNHQLIRKMRSEYRIKMQSLEMKADKTPADKERIATYAAIRAALLKE